jgi:hypothetical protein
MQPAVETGALDLPHEEGEGMGLIATRLFAGERTHHKEAQKGGVLIAKVSRLGPSGGCCNLLGGERTLAQVIPVRLTMLPSSAVPGGGD